MKEIKIKEDLFRATMQYLSNQPFIQVTQLVNALAQAEAESKKKDIPAPEKMTKK